MPYADNNGIKIYHESCGEGPPLVFLHAGSTNGGLWLYQSMLFAQHYRVVVMDHRGHGRSDKPAAGYAIADHAADLKAVLDALNIDAAVLIGNSLGGMIALQFNLDYPERVAGNVIVSSATALGRDMTAAVRADFIANYPASFSAMMDGAVAQKTLSTRPELLGMLKAYAHVPSNYPATAFAASFADPAGPFGWDISGRLNEITAPTLVLAGDEDGIIPGSESVRLANGLPNATFRSIADVAHFYQLEKPEAFNDELRAFLARHFPA